MFATAHGTIETPAFVTVGTKATVKALTPEQVASTGAEVVLANTYHLYLEPGAELVKTAGGLGKFMNWPGPTMTDSGGFQVFSLGAAYGTGLSKLLKKNEELMLPEAGYDDDATDGRAGIGGAKKGAGGLAGVNGAAKLVEIDREGVMFRSHLDGSAHSFTPEKSIEIQHDIGADIIFAFDECTSPRESVHYQREALDRTHAWARRSLERHQELLMGNVVSMPRAEDRVGLRAERPTAHFVKAKRDGAGGTRAERTALPISLFGIVQGGRHEELRKESAKIIGEMSVGGAGNFGGAGNLVGKSFDGFGIGGSFAKEDMTDSVRWVNEILPEDKPRHLLGIGEPEDLFMAVENGCDLFDCVAPTRNARNGTLYTSHGKINIGNARFTADLTPVDENCRCSTCQNYTKAYLAHLFRAKEMLAATLATIHNLYFIIHMVKGMRQAIFDGNFDAYKADFLAKYL